jgi:large subunit ribosomal protein L22
MAERKDEKQDKAQPKKPAGKKSPAKRSTAKKEPTKARAKAKPKAGSKASAKTKESAAKSGGARATSKTADPEAAEKAKKTPAKAKPKAEGKAKAAKPKTAKPKEKKEAQHRPVVNARARFVRVAPRKARLVADQVRGMPLEQALQVLRFHQRSAARDIAKLLGSAAANAEANHDLVADELRISDIRVDEGPTLRRYRPRALGRATKINKRTSHIHVALTPEE